MLVYSNFIHWSYLYETIMLTYGVCKVLALIKILSFVNYFIFPFPELLDYEECVK